MVEQSMKRRGLGRGLGLASRMEAYTALTWLGSGSAVMVTSYDNPVVSYPAGNCALVLDGSRKEW